MYRYYILFTCVHMSISASTCNLQIIAKAIEQSNIETIKQCFGKTTDLFGKPITAETEAYYNEESQYGTLREIAAKTTKRRGTALKKFGNSQPWGWWEKGDALYRRKRLAHAKIIQYYLDGKGWIGFYDNDKPYYEFTNFARYSIVYNDDTWPTSEHAFQAAKFLPDKPNIANKIKVAESPNEAIKIARENADHIRKDWHDAPNFFGYKNQAMLDIVYTKFNQHQNLKKLLLDTGNAYLEEFAPPDNEWGSGPDGQGENKLGKILMRVRANLQKQSEKLLPSKQPVVDTASAKNLTDLNTALNMLQLVLP